MKILFFGPSLLQAGYTEAFEKLGVVTIVAANRLEAEAAFQIHKRTLHAAFIEDEGGIELVRKIKAQADFKTFPFILVTGKWSDSQCLDHQNSMMGVHAYLKLPVNNADLIKTLDQVIGSNLEAGAPIDYSWTKNQVKLREQAEVKTKLTTLTKRPLQVQEVTRTLAPEDQGITIQFDNPELTLGESAPATSTQPSTQQPVSSAKTNAGISLNNPGEIQIQFDDPSPAFSQPTSIKVPAPSPSAAAKIALAPAQQPQKELTRTDVQQASPAIPQRPNMDLILENIPAEMDYLQPSAETTPATRDSGAVHTTMIQFPVNDAIIPGGVSQPPDLETLKKYLGLRELDVATLSRQLKDAHEQVHRLEQKARIDTAKNSELERKIDDLNKKIEKFDEEKISEFSLLKSNLEDVQADQKVKSELLKKSEHRLREAEQEINKIKERVRIDIRKIRVREKELENRIEMMKRDGEALLQARENRIVELKRQLDLAEFNLDLLQDQLEQKKNEIQQMKDKLSKAAQAFRMADGFLGDNKPPVP